MPKRKTYSGRSRIRNSRRLLRSLRYKPSAAKRALSIAKNVRKLVNKTIVNKSVEGLLHDVSITTTAGAYGGFFGCAQGNTENTREGNSVCLMKEKFSFYIAGPLTTGVNESNNTIRMLIVESIEGNTSLALSDVLKYADYSSVSTGGGMVFSSPYTRKTETNKRYKIHMDKTFNLNYYSTSHSRKFSHTVKYGKTGKVVHFNDNESAPTDHRLQILCISDSGVAAHPLMNMSYRGTYKDA